MSCRLLCAMGLAAGLLVPPAARADVAQPVRMDESVRRHYEQSVLRGIEFLETIGQAEDGSYHGAAGPGVTALVTTALLRHGRSPDDPVVARSLEYLESFVQSDGGVYRHGSFHGNYETSLSVLAFAAANVDGRYDELLQRAEAYLLGIQWDESEGIDASDFAYGGAGYGSRNRPDLSNTAYFIDALKTLGHDSDSEAIQRALIFVSRSQNLETEFNTTPFSALNPDGGFYYTPAAGGQSMAGETEVGGLRSYGSMTYAGLKSMIHAGVGPDDPRVQAAVSWIQRHYTLEVNPQLGDAGLYYYYHTFAKALDALGQDLVEDENGVAHDWRAELIVELAGRQQPDGSWRNENPRWLEADPSLVTGYALLALAYGRPPSE